MWAGLLSVDVNLFRDCIIAEHLDLTDVARLDIALTNKVIRAQFRGNDSWNLDQPHCHASRLFHELYWPSRQLITIMCDNFALWLIGRAIKSSNISIRESFVESTLLPLILDNIFLPNSPHFTKCDIPLTPANAEVLRAHVTGIHHLTLASDNLESMDDELVKLFATASLEYLAIVDSYDFIGTSIQEPSYCTLELKSLVLKQCRYLDRTFVNTISSVFPMLNELILDDVKWPAGSYHGVSLCRNAKKLKLFRIFDDDIIAIAKGCPLLEYFNIYCSNVTDIGIAAIGEHCSQLEFLNCGLSQKFTSFTPLALGCKKLTCIYAAANKFNQDAITPFDALLVLNLDTTMGLTDKMLINFLSGTPLLQKLYLMGTTVTNAAFTHLHKHVPDLRVLNISFCTKLTAACVTNIFHAENCLEEFVARGNSPLINASIANMAKHGDHLRVLDICHATGVDCAALTHAVQLPALRHLVIERCQHITADSIAKFRALRPLVRVWERDRPESWPAMDDSNSS